MLSRATFYYRSLKPEQAELRIKIKDMAHARVQYGYRRIHVMLRREGWQINHKRVYRLYKEEGLSLRLKTPKRHVSAQKRETRPVIDQENWCWGMDFVSDALYDGRKFRALPIIDVFTRESLAIEVDQSLRGEHVVETLEKVKAERGLPKTIRCDNGPEFISKALDKWAYENNVVIDFSRRGKPTDNAFVESFNGRFRAECLNANWFMSLDDAKKNRKMENRI